MQFYLRTSRNLYHEKDPKLEKLGFTFAPYAGTISHNRWSIDGKPTIHIDSLQELIEFVKNYGDVVLSEEGDCALELEIYNGYRE